jgi:outer membrane protein TolC
LEFERTAAAQRIEERVRNAVNLMRASYPNIQLSRDAAEAARSNLNLVTESYVQGIKSIIDLLDAQNQSLVAERRASNAANDFLVDLIRVQRSIGRYFFFLAEDERNNWFEELQQYFAAAGIKP